MLGGTNRPQPEEVVKGFDDIDRVFALAGDEMRMHKGRGVVRLELDGRAYYLKRYWLAASQLFQRHVSRGLHELRMIDWLNENGFAGPVVVARGHSRILGLTNRLFFLMAEQEEEHPLEQAWWLMPDRADELIDGLAGFAARLHDSGFVHTDFSERHIYVGRSEGDWTFRLIDVERARVGRIDDRAAAADLKTLAASIDDQVLRERVGTTFLDGYAARRVNRSGMEDWHELFKQARATRAF